MKIATSGRGSKTALKSAVVVLAIGSFTLLSFTNCSRVVLVKSLGSESIESLFGKLKPALAVRSPACISCHAKVYGDFITDFGLGSPYFFGLDRSVNHPNDPHYGPFEGKHTMHDLGATVSTNTMSIFGNLIVPDARLTDARVIASIHAGGAPATTSSISLKDMMTQPFRNFSGNITTMFTHQSSSDEEIPGVRGNIESRHEIYIGAPTEEEIRSIFYYEGFTMHINALGATVKRGNLDIVQGLIAKQGSSRRYYLTNNGNMTCIGDVIIDGTLLLKNLNLITDSRGCRLYVTQTVFIQGPIEYVGGDSSDKNIQITSARAIVIGMKSLSTRLTEEATPYMTEGIRQAYSDTQEDSYNARIVDDREKVLDAITNDAGPFMTMKSNSDNHVIAVLDDYDSHEFVPLPGETMPPLSTCAPYNSSPSATCTVNWAMEYNRKTVNYKHVLFNAPKVYSRYYGTMTGAVVGEDVLFAVNHFTFQSDPVLSRVNLLPLVQDRIFHVSDY